MLIILTTGDLLAFTKQNAKIQSLEVISDNKETQTYTYDLFKDLIGTNLSFEKTAVLIKALKNKEDVEKVRVDAKEEGENLLKLIVSVRLKFRVKRVTFEGHDSFSTSRLRSVIVLKNDTLFAEHDLNQAVDKIKTFYEQQGYLQAAVSYERIFSQAKSSGTLNFKIDEGDRCRIDSLKVVGDLSGKTQDYILKNLSIKKGAFLSRSYIEKKIKNLDKKLLKQGYRSVKIEGPLTKLNKEKTLATLILHVNLGPKIKIVFKGNRYFFERDSKLKREIRFKDERQFSTSWVEAAKFELERFYKKLGYARVEVSHKNSLNQKGTERTIAFLIKRNRKVLIKKVLFSGNKAFDQEYLEDKLYESNVATIKKKLYVKEDLTKALKRLIGFYQSEGYLKAYLVGDAKAKYDKRKKRVAVTVSLSEGNRFFVGNVEVKGNTFVSTSQIREMLNIDRDKPYDPFSVDEGITRLEDFYKENGFKFVRVYKEEVVGEEDVALAIIVSEGDRVKIGSIKIIGNRTTDEKILKREFKISAGSYYSPSKISESEKEVARLGLFSSVAFEEVNYNIQTKELDLVLKVAEKKKRNLRTRIGYGSDEGLRSGADLTFINIGGKGRSLAIGLELSHRLEDGKILRRKETVSYREPSLFGSKLAGKIGLIDERDEEPQFNIDRTAFSFGFDASLTKALRPSITYNLEYRKPFDLKVPEEDLSPFDESRKRLAFIDITVDYDKRNNIFTPTNGFFQRLVFNAYNRAIGSESSFLQVMSINSFYKPIYKRFRFLVSVKFGFTWTYGSTRDEGLLVPIEKRFRLGGPHTIRGFPLNSVGGLASNEPVVGGGGIDDQAAGGNSMFNYNLELITPLPFNFDFVLFTDGGEAWKINSEFNPIDIRNTAGFGLRYNTPIGPVRLDVGFVLDKREGEEWGQIHFSVGQL